MLKPIVLIALIAIVMGTAICVGVVYNYYSIPSTGTIVIRATVDIDPDALGLRNKTGHITAFIELQESGNMSDINVSSILLNDTIPVSPHAPTAIGDYDGDGIQDLMVKFNRTEITEYILDNVNMTKLVEEKTMNITLTITGQLNRGVFEGSDTIIIKDGYF